MHKFLLRFIFSSIAGLILFNSPHSVIIAQPTTGEIHGTIKDRQHNEPLIGSNILLQGTNLGSNSDYDGNFKVKNVPPGRYNLLARFVGYKQQSKEVNVTAGASIEINFALEPTTVQMGEIVVTGQGAAVEKRKLASTVESISSSDIQYAPVKTLDGLLQGRIPGLSAFSTSGLPGTGMRLMTRGVKSATLSTTPVIYVDGVRVDAADNFAFEYGTGGMVSSSLADLVVGDIDRVEVIKGGAASTLYGSEAANGVIQIFTKKGVPGAGRWKINITTGFDKPELKFTMEEFTKEKFYQTGSFQSYNVNLAGGTDLISYNLSGKASYSPGVITQDKIDDKMYSIASGFRAILSENSNLEVSATYVNHSYGFVYNDNNVYAPLSRLETANMFVDPNSAASKNKDSVLRSYLLPEVFNSANRFTTATNLSYSPFPGFNNKLTIGVDYRQSEQSLYASPETGPIVVTPGGYQRRSGREYLTITFGYLGSYILPEIGPVSQTVSVGGQGFHVEDRQRQHRGNNYGVPGTTNYNNFVNFGAFENNIQLFNGGFYFNDQIGVFEKIFIDLGVRFDGNSTFGKSVGIQTYPKAGLAYNISEESFYPGFLKTYLSSLKLRGSWGQTGSYPPPFTRDRTYTATTFLSDVALDFSNPGDKDLKPEKTTSYEYGFDAGLLDDKVSIEFSYFNQQTTGALFVSPLDPASGFDSQLRNIGKIENKGIEISLRANILRLDDLELNLRASLATLENKVLDLGGAASYNIAGYDFASMWVRQGEPIGIFRYTEPVAEADGTYAGNYKYVYGGVPTPKQTGSLGIDITLFKNLSISAFGEFALGHNIINHILSRRVVGGYPDAVAKLPTSTNPNNPYTRNTAGIIFVEKGDWYKIREISIRYNIPKLLFKGVTITGSVRNVAILGLSAGCDPEVYFDRSTLTNGLEIGGLSGASVSPPIQFRLGFDIAL
jgi:TonB-dependent starch-binding outer membrane protein SusC